MAPRPRAGWVESRIGFAEAAIETGTEGAGADDIEEAIIGLQQILRDKTYAPSSSKGAAIQDLQGSLYLIRARSTSARADFELAIKAGLRATSGAWQEMCDSEAVGAHQHLAAAHRDFGIWLMADHPDEARSHLAKAAHRYELVAQAYRSGLNDMNADEERTGLISAKEAVDDIQKFTAALPPKNGAA